MGKHDLTPAKAQDILDSDLVHVVQSIAASAAVSTPESRKRVNSGASAANGILQVGAVLLGMSQDWPLWAIIAVMVVLFVAEIVVQASTKTPVTNNVVRELAAEASRQVQAGKVKLPSAPRLPKNIGFTVVPRPQVSFNPAPAARPVDDDGYVTEYAEE